MGERRVVRACGFRQMLNNYAWIWVQCNPGYGHRRAPRPVHTPPGLARHPEHGGAISTPRTYPLRVKRSRALQAGFAASLAGFATCGFQKGAGMRQNTMKTSWEPMKTASAQKALSMKP